MSIFIEQYNATYENNILSLIIEDNCIKLKYPSHFTDEQLHAIFQLFSGENLENKLKSIEKKCNNNDLIYKYYETNEYGPGKNPLITFKYVVIGNTTVCIGEEYSNIDLATMSLYEVNNFFDFVIDIEKNRNEYVNSLKTFGSVVINLSYHPIATLRIGKDAIQLDINLITKKFTDIKLIEYFGVSIDATIENINFIDKNW